MIARNRQSYEYPDDIFDNTRMTFGDHIDELRTRMIRAIQGLLVCMVAGFILDGIGSAVGNPKIGIGKPMLDIITEPVETQVRDFYSKRANEEAKKRLPSGTDADPDELARLQEKFKANGYALSLMTPEEQALLLGAPEQLPIRIPAEAFAPVFGDPKPGAPKEIVTTIQVYPAHMTYLSEKGQTLLGIKKYVATMSAQESMVVYFKVSIVCGLVLSSPWLLYQFWAFVGAGLYPHEKKHVYVLFWPSVLLFFGGVLLCQFVVLPGAVRALLRFNDWLGFDPDIRLTEWFGLALILPLVFGISFQTPLVMIALNRIGILTAADYISKWRYACFGMAVLAAVLTPTPDPITMMYMFVPMFGLYLAGIAFCYYFPGTVQEEEEAEAEEVAV
jgi:sec-independent protein translocase protein TatC